MNLTKMKPKLVWQDGTLTWGPLVLVTLKRHKIDGKRVFCRLKESFAVEFDFVAIHEYEADEQWGWDWGRDNHLPDGTDSFDYVRKIYQRLFTDIDLCMDYSSEIDKSPLFAGGMPSLYWTECPHSGHPVLCYGNFSLIHLDQIVRPQWAGPNRDVFRLDGPAFASELVAAATPALGRPGQDDGKRPLHLPATEESKSLLMNWYAQVFEQGVWEAY